jgi:hypothetical protein
MVNMRREEREMAKTAPERSSFLIIGIGLVFRALL